MEQHLKERLVGAVVLTLAAVILIPIILSGSPSLEPVNGLEQDAGTPAVGVGSQPFSSKIVPLGTTTPLGSASPERESVSAPVTFPELPKSKISSTRVDKAPLQPAPTQVKIKPVVPAPAPTPTPAGNAAQSKGWLVQLGSFSNARNASNLKQRLQKMNYPAFTRSSKTDKGDVTKVFVGPVASPQQAKKLAARLEAVVKGKSMVIRQP